MITDLKNAIEALNHEVRQLRHAVVSLAQNIGPAYPNTYPKIWNSTSYYTKTDGEG